MDEIKDRWEEIKENLREEYELTNISFSNWIAPLKFHKVENDMVTILVPTEQGHLINYIQKKYHICFKATISELMNHDYDVEFKVENDASLQENASKNASRTNEAGFNQANYEKANLNSKYTFKTFVVGSNNKFANSAALAVADSPGKFTIPFIYTEVRDLAKHI